jgi:hypothetical protein
MLISLNRETSLFPPALVNASGGEVSANFQPVVANSLATHRYAGIFTDSGRFQVQEPLHLQGF